MYKAAIIGFGGMGKWHFRATKGRFEELDVTGAYDIRPEANEEARAESLRAYNSAEEIFADPNIDVVIIATPNDSHKDYILGALAANKHVVCEKPVVLSSEDLVEVMEAEKHSQ